MFISPELATCWLVCSSDLEEMASFAVLTTTEKSTEEPSKRHSFQEVAELSILASCARFKLPCHKRPRLRERLT